MAALQEATVELDKVEAKDLLNKYRYLLSTPSVVSLSYCSEKKEGKKTGRYVLRVGVIKKLPANEIEDPDILLPKTVVYETPTKKVAVPVQVVEEGVIQALGPPYKGGSQVMTTGAIEQGTLGVNTQYKGTYRLLSAAHVLTQFDPGNIGKAINARSDPVNDQYQPMGTTVEGQVNVTLYTSSSEPNPVYAKQDLAWATVTPQQGSPEIIDIGAVNGIRDPNNSEKVQFYGAASEELQSDIVVADTSTMVTVRFQDGIGSYKYGYFEDVCMLDISNASPLPGDSGSAMIAQSDKAIVGILFATGLLSAHFCKLTF